MEREEEVESASQPAFPSFASLSLCCSNLTEEGAGRKGQTSRQGRPMQRDNTHSPSQYRSGETATEAAAAAAAAAARAAAALGGSPSAPPTSSNTKRPTTYYCPQSIHRESVTALSLLSPRSPSPSPPPPPWPFRDATSSSPLLLPHPPLPPPLPLSSDVSR